MADTCKSCGAKIRWVRMARTGKAMPLNAEPDAERGNIMVSSEGVGAVLEGEILEGELGEGTPLYLSHFATCSQAGNWRRK